MILCLGTTPVFQRSMVFERLEPDAVNRAAAVHDYASGKSVNVARVLHTLGAEVLAVGFAGGDRGLALLRDLDAAGVRHDFVTTAHPTRQCVTVIDRSRGSATELVEESTHVAAPEWAQLHERLDRLLPRATGVILSGSLPPGAPQDFYLTCLRRVPPSVPTVLDTRGQPLRGALRHPGFIAKLNREELASTVGHALDADDALVRAMREIMPPGGATVVTLGAKGALAMDARGAWRLQVPAVPARSAVGSGDAFAAGLTLGLLRKQPLPDACAFATACGAANAMTDRAGHLSREDVERLRPQVRIEPL